MKNRPLLLLCSIALLSACATTHPGQMAQAISGPPQPLNLSAERQPDFSDDHYTFITFTSESKANDMLRIKATDISFADGAKDTASVLVGKDLVAWAEAHEEQMKKEQHNRKLAQLSMIIGGAALAVAGIATHNNGLAAAGGAAYVGGAGWALGSKMSESIEKAHNPKPVPDEHIYAPFSVPVGKFLRKWAVIQHPVGVDIKKLLVLMTFEDGTETTYALDLK